MKITIGRSNRRAQTGSWFILLSFLLGLLLTIMPLPEWARYFRPAWLAMVLIFWMVVMPRRVAYGIAFLCGILLDSLNGSTLGEHSIALLSVAFIVSKLYRQLRVYPLPQQAVAVFLLTIFYEFIVEMLHGLMGENYNFTVFWYPAIASMLLWPWLYVLLNDLTRRFRVSEY